MNFVFRRYFTKKIEHDSAVEKVLLALSENELDIIRDVYSSTEGFAVAAEKVAEKNQLPPHKIYEAVQKAGYLLLKERGCIE